MRSREAALENAEADGKSLTEAHFVLWQCSHTGKYLGTEWNGHSFRSLNSAHHRVERLQPLYQLGNSTFEGASRGIVKKAFDQPDRLTSHK